MDIQTLLAMDQHVMEKLATIDKELLELEHNFVRMLCTYADVADVDRRIVLQSSLLAIEKLWSDMIMTL